VRSWKRQKRAEPIVWIDFTALRRQRNESAQQLAFTAIATQLAEHPLAHWALPVIAFPEITLALSLPEVPLPTRHRVSQTLDWASRFSLAFAVALALLFAGPIAILETQSLVSRAVRLIEPAKNDLIATAPEPLSAATMEPNITSPKDIFSISFPDLGIESTITPNVDPADPKAYRDALKEGIAHAAGTGLPGQLDVNKTIYLFAHSTDGTWNINRYNAQFYALKDAQPGQLVTVRFWGEDFRYRITETKIVAADDTSSLQPQFETEKLVLQTCYPPGTTWKRLLVIAEPASQD
jgi:sortase A